MDEVDKKLVQSAYLAIRATQEVIRAVASKTLGPESNHAFTIDGKLLGDLGELVACLEFGLTPAPTGTKGIDAYTPNGRSVQVKSTAGTTGVYIPGNSDAPDFIIAIQFDKSTGEWNFVFFGEAETVWRIATHPVDSGKTISLRTLAKMQSQLGSEASLSPPDSK